MTKKNECIFPIGHILKKRNSDIENHVLNFRFEDENGVLRFAKPIEVDIALSGMDDGIFVQIFDLETSIYHPCEKCLVEVEVPIFIEEAEYMFYKRKPKDALPGEEVYTIDMKKFEIDISHPLYQECLLQVPMIVLCDENCKGLCLKCGVNINSEICDCENDKDEDHIEGLSKPFEGLQKLFDDAKGEGL